MSRKRFTVTLDEDLINRLRWSVMGLQRQGRVDVTVTSSVTDALTTWCEQTEHAHNDGHPWPPADELRTGRPLTTPHSRTIPGNNAPERKEPQP